MAAVKIDNSNGTHTFWVETYAELPEGLPTGTLCVVQATGKLYIVNGSGSWVTFTA